MISRFSRVQLFATLWTVAHQALLWDSLGKNTGVGYHGLLQGIFLTQGLNPCLLCLLHCIFTSLWELANSTLAIPQNFPTPTYENQLETDWSYSQALLPLPTAG